MAKGRNGGSDTLSAESIGFGSGFKEGDGGDRSGFLNQASADMGNPFAEQRQGGILGGFFNPGRMIGSGIGTMVAGPIGGLLGGLIGGGGMRGWGYTDPQGNRVSAFRDMFDGGGRGTFGDTFEGGLLSGVANSMGIRPAGYRARQAAGVGQPEAGSQGGAGTSVYSSPAPSSLEPLPPAPSVGGLTPNRNGMIQGTGQMPNMQGAVPGMTAMPNLTTAQINRLREMGVTPGGVGGEPASHAEMAALLRGPSMLPFNNLAPNVLRQYDPANPSREILPDGSTVQSYSTPPGVDFNSSLVDPMFGAPMLNVPSLMPQSLSAPPSADVYSTPRPPGRGLGPDPTRANLTAQFREMQRRALEAQGLLVR